MDNTLSKYSGAMNELLVEHDGKVEKVTLDVNHTISLKYLQTYFPGTTGLSWTGLDGITTNVPVDSNENLFIPQNVKLFRTRVSSNTNFLGQVTAMRSQKLLHMLGKITDGTAPAAKKQKLSEAITAKESLTTKTKQIQPTVKLRDTTVRGRWYHKDFDDENYLPRSSSKNSKILTFQIPANKFLNSQQLLEKITELFCDNFTRTIIENSSKCLGNWTKDKTPVPIPPFDNIFDYFKANNLQASKVSFTLLTHAQTELSISDIMRPFPSITFNNKQQSALEPSVPSSNQQQIMPPKLHASLKQITSHHEESEEMQYDHIIISTPGVMPDVCYSITVYYCVNIINGDTVVKFHMSKEDLYNTLLHNNEIENVSYDEFEPVLRDYPISKILLNSELEIYNIQGDMHDQILLKRDTNEHVIYDCDYLRGRCEGRFGIGVLAKCSVKNPYYIWYKNGKVFKEGINLFWIMCDTEGNPWTDTWACTINCSKFNNVKSTQSDSSSSSINLSGKTHANSNSNFLAPGHSRKLLAHSSLPNKVHLNSHSHYKTSITPPPLPSHPSLANKLQSNSKAATQAATSSSHPSLANKLQSNSKTAVQADILPVHPSLANKLHLNQHSNSKTATQAGLLPVHPSLANKLHLNQHSNSKTATQTGPLPIHPSLANKLHLSNHSKSKTATQTGLLPVHPSLANKLHLSKHSSSKTTTQASSSLPHEINKEQDLISTSTNKSNHTNVDSLSGTFGIKINLKNYKLPVINPDDMDDSNATPLGKGGQGTVVRSKWKQLDVAVKKIEIHHGSYPMLMKELEVLDVIRHGNIIETYGVYLKNCEFFIVMDLIDNGSCLHDILFIPNIKSSFNLSIEQRNYIAVQIATGIHYMHSLGIVHADIKPDNILVTKKFYKVKICDFGYSKLVNFGRMSFSAVIPVGTYIYMAPELIVDHRSNSIQSDLWAVGCTLAELYREKITWKVNNATELREKFHLKQEPDLRAVPVGLRETVRKFLSYEPKSRPDVDTVITLYIATVRGWKY